MKKAGQLVLVISAAAFVLLSGLVLARNTLIKCIIEQGVRSTTGVGLTIHSMNIGLTTVAVDIRGMELHNPWGFHEDIMMDVPQVSIGIRGRDLLKGKIHFESIKLNMNEFVVIKNEHGDVNVNALKPVKDSKKQQASHTAKPAGKAPQMQIDVLEYTIGKVVYKDYSQGSPPKVQEFPINVTRKYTNITNPAFIASIIVTEAVARTAVARLANVDVSGVRNAVSSTLKDGAQKVGGAAQEAADAIKDLFKQ